MHRISIDASNICSRIKYLLMHQISCDDHQVNGDYVVSSPDTVCSYREAHGPQGSWSKKVWEPLLYRELHVTCALVQPPRDKSSLNWKTLHCVLCQSVIINREMGLSEREREWKGESEWVRERNGAEWEREWESDHDYHYFKSDFNYYFLYILYNILLINS